MEWHSSLRSESLMKWQPPVVLIFSTLSPTWSLKSSSIYFLNWFFDHDGVIFFFLVFYQNGVRLKKITNLGKSCQFGTTSYAKIVPIRHDFCPVILKSYNLSTTSALSYWSRANLARLLPYHTEVVPSWHDFYDVIFF